MPTAAEKTYAPGIVHKDPSAKNKLKSAQAQQKEAMSNLDRNRFIKNPHKPQETDANRKWH